MVRSKIKIQDILSDASITCFVIPSLFSKGECEQLLSPEIKSAFQKANTNYPNYYRNNERFVVDDKWLADQLFKKVKNYLPERIKVQSEIKAENGLWHLKALNERIRFCKYSANQYFHKHLDGVHYYDEVTQSKLTFMIYLNSATHFKGGRTLFYKTKDAKEVWASYVPKQGDLIVFDHNIWHEGEVLTEGEKFVLRSDILYTKKNREIKEEPFIGHLGYVWSLLKFDDSTILSGGRDKQIKVWSTSGTLIHSLTGHDNSILCLEKITDNIFISGSRDQHIIIWKDFKIFKKVKIHDAVVLSLCRLEKEIFVSSSGDNTIKVNHLNGVVLKTFVEHTSWVWQIVKIDKHIIASCSEDCSIKIWDIHCNKSIRTISGSDPIISIAYNAQTCQLISGNLKGEITILVLNDNYQEQEVLRFMAHIGVVRTIKFINETCFATGGEDNKMRIWTTEGRLISEIKHLNFVQSIELINKHQVVSASYDGSIKTTYLQDWD